MHKNHRRKNKYRNEKPRWWTHLAEYKQIYWARERARERHLMSHDRHDDFQDFHPKNILWDVL